MEYFDINSLIPELLEEINEMAQQIADELMPRPESKYPNSKLLKLKDKLNGNKHKNRPSVQLEETQLADTEVRDFGGGTAI